MNDQEKFDDILKSKFSEREFSFEEEDWTGAEKMINAFEERKKKKRWAIIFFLGFFIGGIITILVFENTNNSLSDKTSPSTDKKKYENSLSDLRDNKQDNKNVDAERDNEFNVGNAPEANNNKMRLSSSVKNQKGESTLNVQQNQNNITSGSVADKNVKVNSLADAGKITPSSVMKIEIKKNPASAERNQNKIQNAKNNSIKITEGKKGTHPEIGITISKNDKQIEQKRKTDNKSDSALTIAERNSVTDKTDGENSISINKSTAVVNQLPAKDTLSDQQKQSGQKVIPEKDNVVAPSEPASVQNNKQDSLIKNKDTVAASGNNTETIPEKTVSAKKHIVSIDAGTGFVMGWNYGGIVEGRGFNPVAGFSYTHFLDPKWSFGIGVQYTSIAYLGASKYTAQDVKYDFGYSSAITIIETKTLHYITVPFQLRYNLNGKNYFGAGIDPSYLISGVGKITTYNQTNFAITNKKEITQAGYGNGFNQWDVSVMATYGRRFSNRFSSSLVAYFGMLDIKDNSFFSQQNIEHNTGIRLLMSYDIFK